LFNKQLRTDFLNSGNNFVLAQLGFSTAETIGINRLPLSGTRGQPGSQICFATLILQKITNTNNSATTEARPK
jgi:hypothetical protein